MKGYIYIFFIYIYVSVLIILMSLKSVKPILWFSVFGASAL